MKTSSFLTVLLTCSALFLIYINHSQYSTDQFDRWKSIFGTPFQPQEEIYRRLIFHSNLQMIHQHNADLTQTFRMGINQFTIYSNKQFKTRFLSVMNPTQIKPIPLNSTQQTLNVEIDWTTKGAVSPIKNQGQCGSCWAFSAIASTQSWALLNNKYVSLSEQQLVDCSHLYGNAGCDGGWAQRALKYIKDHGISTQIQYPYKGRNQKCQKKGGDFKINVVSSVLQCRGLQNMITQRPVSVSVDAQKWSHYSSGVFNDCGHSTDHAVLLVGVVGGAWKIKNSWGRSWGQNGFIRLAAGNTCGICIWGGSYPH